MTKTLFAAAAASLLAVGAASAQTEPAPAPAHDHHAVDHQAAHPTIDSTIEALVADPATKAVLDKHLPGIDRHPAYAQFKGMTLRQVAPFSQGNITDAKIAAIDTDLKAIPAA
ncbi:MULTISPECIES: hypothetical protein [unclassified Brevundimonas]|uniref:hypothetical protein n=1 Tax=unclassified Brevundimonas TaxID=2622653 RepID=UPI000E961E55|nr:MULTISPECIES: hypothetical protein [unclassified Brevundimonas]MCK6103364.1 hypothetical protein [Brevundimonas sp. EYE_349]HBI17755.1 hypothetical protein [Brevundimonas sp.]